ncbi:hypothetical protein HS088_TW18G00914 [Tripterygium wilfordii]|uniref:J domain-containing protein n=1 Tax=Tripterygium wilfordii TaxID=458696 RepID=A0A7J7CDM4_TRIWF|nr:hypothetical protein HS088_TW18G00914 [Tripterygium wilfordii]
MTNMTNLECNKSEAARALEIAQMKLAEMDIYGAKAFALKAQNLHPDIDGVPQLLTTLEVYISAEQRIDGEVDWYRVLGVEPLADDETIRKHFKKLAFILHPDKNKSEGAEGAFKIVSEAWSCLSDKLKRLAYDQKRYMQRIQHTVLNGNSSLSAGQNGSYHFTDSSNQNAMNRMNARHRKPSQRSRRAVSKPVSFWTICSCCSLHLEYDRKYLNNKLLCPRCRKSFLAFEIPPPSSRSSISNASRTSYAQQQNSTQNTTNENFYATGSEVVSPTDKGPAFQPVALFKSGDIGSVPAPAPSDAQATDDVQPNYDQLKRKHDDFLTTPVREEAVCRKNHAASKIDAGLATGSSNARSGFLPKGDRPKKKRHLDEGRTDEREMANFMATRNVVGLSSSQQGNLKIDGGNAAQNCKPNGANFMATGNGVGLSSSQKGNLKIDRGNATRNCKPNGARQPSRMDTRNLLTVKARMQIVKKVSEWNIAAESKDSVNLKASDKEMVKKHNGKEEAPLGAITTDSCSPNNSDVDPDTKGIDPLSMSVPDPDFHDFDGDRVEKSFRDNQVWAVYDDDDGMPRYYAMIHNMLSVKPFKMRISWLNSKSNSELGPLNWIASGFPKTTGDFRKGKSVTNKSLNSFSHKVKWTKGVKGAIKIYPRKGDVWALYRNWSPDWNASTPDEVVHQYDMAEVLEDYNEEMGVAVAPLYKVAGFKTVFRKQFDPTKTRIIPREELFRFSHQVPSYLLTGKEGHNAPRNCVELDPAATPLELLQVLTDIQLSNRLSIEPRMQLKAVELANANWEFYFLCY